MLKEEISNWYTLHTKLHSSLHVKHVKVYRRFSKKVVLSYMLCHLALIVGLNTSSVRDMKVF